MRFWMKSRIDLAGSAPIHTDDKAVINKYKAARHNINTPIFRLKKYGIVINGEAEITDKAKARVLIQAGGSLLWDLEEAKQMFDRAELKSMGILMHDGLDDRVPEIPQPKEEPKLVLPDFDVMTKADLQEYANDNEIFLDPRARKDDMVQEIRRKLKK